MNSRSSLLSKERKYKSILRDGKDKLTLLQVQNYDLFYNSGNVNKPLCLEHEEPWVEELPTSEKEKVWTIS